MSTYKPSSKPAESERLRQEIDHGRTRDKVSGSDPAAAPLEADAEAAGTPTPPSAVATAVRQETNRSTELNRDVIDDEKKHNPFAFLFLTALAVSFVAFLAGLWLLA